MRTGGGSPSPWEQSCAGASVSRGRSGWTGRRVRLAVCCESAGRDAGVSFQRASSELELGNAQVGANPVPLAAGNTGISS